MKICGINTKRRTLQCVKIVKSILEKCGTSMGGITSISATAPETVLTQPVWYNKQIKIDNKSIFKKKMDKIGNIFYQ